MTLQNVHNAYERNSVTPADSDRKWIMTRRRETQFTAHDPSFGSSVSVWIPWAADTVTPSIQWLETNTNLTGKITSVFRPISTQWAHQPPKGATWWRGRVTYPKSCDHSCPRKHRMTAQTNRNQCLQSVKDTLRARSSITANAACHKHLPFSYLHAATLIQEITMEKKTFGGVCYIIQHSRWDRTNRTKNKSTRQKTACMGFDLEEGEYTVGVCRLCISWQ